MASNETIVQATDRPNAQPGRSQPSAAGAGGSSRRTGSSGPGGGAMGPRPARPASHSVANTTPESRTSPNASNSGVTLSGPAFTAASILPRASADSPTIAPPAAGA